LPVVVVVYPVDGYAPYAPPSKLKVNPVVADVTVMVAVASEQGGCVTLVVGATGVPGCALTVAVAVPDIQPASFFTLMVCSPVVVVVYPVDGYAPYAPPSKLKVNPVVADVTVMVAVASDQVGCVTLVVGATGVPGCAFIVPLVADEMQPVLNCLTVMLYVAPAATVKEVAG